MTRQRHIFTGIVLVGGVVAFGTTVQDGMVILPFALIFAATFGIGFWRVWVRARHGGRSGAELLGTVSTFVSQVILCGLLYLAGRGIAETLGQEAAPVLALSDSVAFLMLAVTSIGAGLVFLAVEAARPTRGPSLLEAGLPAETSVVNRRR